MTSRRCCCKVGCVCPHCTANEGKATCCIVGDDGTDKYFMRYKSSCTWSDPLGGTVTMTATDINFSTPNGSWSAPIPADCENFTVNFGGNVEVASADEDKCTHCPCTCSECPDPFYATCCWVLNPQTSPIYLNSSGDCTWEGGPAGCSGDWYTMTSGAVESTLSGPLGTTSIPGPVCCQDQVTFPSYGTFYAGDPGDCYKQIYECGSIRVEGVVRQDCGYWDGWCEETNRVAYGTGYESQPGINAFGGNYCSEPDWPLPPDGSFAVAGDWYGGPVSWTAYINQTTGFVQISLNERVFGGGTALMAQFEGTLDDAVGGRGVRCLPTLVPEGGACDWSGAIAWLLPGPLCAPCPPSIICPDRTQPTCPCGGTPPDQFELFLPAAGYNGWGPGVDETILVTGAGDYIDRGDKWCNDGPSIINFSPCYNTGETWMIDLRWNWQGSQRARLSFIWAGENYGWACETTQWFNVDCSFIDFGGTLPANIHRTAWDDYNCNTPVPGNPLWLMANPPTLTPA